MYLRPYDVFYDPGISITDHAHTSQPRLTTIVVKDVSGFARDLIAQEISYQSLTRLGRTIVSAVETEGGHGLAHITMLRLLIHSGLCHADVLKYLRCVTISKHAFQHSAI